jgi:hypothetical protein
LSFTTAARRKGDQRTPSQRRADGLVELADRVMDRGELPAILADVFGGVAAVAAVVAAVYSVITWRQGQREEKVADRRWSMHVEPRLRIVTINRATNGCPAIVEVLNAGRAASTSLLAIHDANGVFVGGTAVPSQWRAHRDGPDASVARAVVIAARDIEGSWRDCIDGSRIPHFLPWWAARLESLGIEPVPLETSRDGLSIHFKPPDPASGHAG